MDKYKTRVFLISAIFFAFMITPIHGHDEGMSSEEITVMIQEILNSVGDLGAVSYTHLTLPTIYSV